MWYFIYVWQILVTKHLVMQKYIIEKLLSGRSSSVFCVSVGRQIFYFFYCFSCFIEINKVILLHCLSSRPEVFCKKRVLKNFTKFTGIHLCQILFFNEVTRLRRAILLKILQNPQENTCSRVSFLIMLQAEEVFS